MVLLNTGAVLGICIGGAAFLLLFFSALIVCHQRKKHKAKLAEIDRHHSQRRAHLSITDEDVRRMPGTRRLRPSVYSNPSGWAPVSSRKSIAKKGLSPNPADIDPVTGLPPWPVRIPRRLKKVQSTPAVRIPLAALSPITERSTNNTATSPSLSKTTDPERDSKIQLSQGTVRGVYRLDSCPNFDVSPNLFKPRPLFQDQQRSFSHGVLASINKEGGVPKSSTPSSQNHAESSSLQLARMRRSSSLCSQQPGSAPTIPVPPLPFELEATSRPQALKIRAETSPRRMSGMSLLSGDTSVLDDKASKAFSQAETDFTSINLSSPPISAPTSIGLGISGEVQPKWNFSRVDRSASPFSAASAQNLKPHINQQHSFRASVRNSLPRSTSSGLSMSLLDHHSPNPKAALEAAKSINLEIPGRHAGNPARRSQVLQSSRLDKVNVFKLNDDMKAKRASTSILQVVSGNQTMSPVKNPWTDRPTSIATDDPFRWDSKTSMQPGRPSAMKNNRARRQGHKRQSCVRISNDPTVIPSENRWSFKEDRLPPSIAPPASLIIPPLFVNTTKDPHPHTKTSILLPPSRPTFEPHLPKDIRSSASTNRTTTTDENHDPTTSPYSPTFSMIPLYSSPFPSPSPTHSPSPSRYASSTSTSSSVISTPTRPPLSSFSLAHRLSAARPSRNPNRRRQIFPSANGPAWPPLLSSSITPADPPSCLFFPLPLQGQGQPAGQLNASPRFSSAEDEVGFAQARQEQQQQQQARTSVQSTTADTTITTGGAGGGGGRDSSSEWDSRPPSFLLSFPSPPSPPLTVLPVDPPPPPQPRHPSHTFPPNHVSSAAAAARRTPSPPKPSARPNTRTSPIRGPRPLHPHPHPPLPSRVNKTVGSGSGPGSPRGPRSSRRANSPAKNNMDVLRRSIMELRRMNSEVVHHDNTSSLSTSYANHAAFEHNHANTKGGGGGGGGLGHARYLSLGDNNEPVPAEGEEEVPHDTGGAIVKHDSMQRDEEDKGEGEGKWIGTGKEQTVDLASLVRMMRGWRDVEVGKEGEDRGAKGMGMGMQGEMEMGIVTPRKNGGGSLYDGDGFLKREVSGALRNA